MSFKCGFCHMTAPKGSAQRLVPVKTRTRQDDTGTEIVREEKMCEACWREGVSEPQAVLS